MPMEKIASIHNKRRATAGNQRSILRFARPGSTRCMAANAMYVTKTGTSNDDTAIRPFVLDERSGMPRDLGGPVRE